MFALFLMSRAALAADCDVITGTVTESVSRDEVKCYIVRDCVFEKVHIPERSYLIQLGVSNVVTDVTITGVTLDQCTGGFDCFFSYFSGSLTISGTCVYSCSCSGNLFHGYAMRNENIPIAVNETSLVACAEKETTELQNGFYLQGFSVKANVDVANVNTTGCHLMTSQEKGGIVHTEDAIVSLRMLTLVGNSGSYALSSGFMNQDSSVLSSKIEMTNVVENEKRAFLWTSVTTVTWSNGVFKGNSCPSFVTFPTYGVPVPSTVTLIDSVFDKQPDTMSSVTTQNVQTQENPTTHDIAALNTALCPGNFKDEEVPPVDTSSGEEPGPDTATGDENVDGTGDDTDPAIDQKPSTEDNQGGGRLSGGEIAGIVVGVCAAIAIAIAAVVAVLLLVRRKKGERLQSCSDEDV